MWKSPQGFTEVKYIDNRQGKPAVFNRRQT